MSPPCNGIFVVRGEMSIITTAMRRGSRWNSNSYQVSGFFPLKINKPHHICCLSMSINCHNFGPFCTDRRWLMNNLSISLIDFCFLFLERRTRCFDKKFLRSEGSFTASRRFTTGRAKCFLGSVFGGHSIGGYNGTCNQFGIVYCQQIPFIWTNW